MSTTTAQTKYYRLTEDYAELLWQAGFSGADWRIWLYLVLADPFGDGYQKLPDVLDVMQKCNVSKATFYRAIAKFQELGLFDFQASICFRNLAGAKSEGRSNLRVDSQNCESNSQNCESNSQNCESNSQNCESNSQNCDNAYMDRARIQTIHNYSNYSHSSESESAVGDSEGGASDPVSEPEQILPPVNSEKPETAEDLHPPSSAAPPSSVVAFEARMRGGNLEPWELSPKRFDYEPGFVQFLVKVYLPEVPSFQKQVVTIDKAQQWLNGARYNEQRKDVAHLQWEKYQRSLQVEGQPVCHPLREFRPVAMPEVDPEARKAGIAKFRSLVQGA